MNITRWQQQEAIDSFFGTVEIYLCYMYICHGFIPTLIFFQIGGQGANLQFRR